MSSLVAKIKDWIVKQMNENQYGELQWDIKNKKDYRNFNNNEDSEKWGTKHYSEWAKQYKKTMIKAKNVVKTSLYTNTIECYCGYSHKGINEFLRYQIDNEDNHYREMADILSIILSAAPTIPCDIVLYRMVNDDFINMLISHNKKDKPTPIQEKGFMSTSLLKSIANESEPYAATNNLLKIFVPKGTVGIYVNAVGNKRSEEEMLLFPNMYLGLISYPYKDMDTSKTIYECKLIYLH